MLRPTDLEALHHARALTASLGLRTPQAFTADQTNALYRLAADVQAMRRAGSRPRLMRLFLRPSARTPSTAGSTATTSSTASTTSSIAVPVAAAATR